MIHGSEPEGGSGTPQASPAHLAPYYLLALQYIDPALRPSSTLTDVFTALKQRRAALLSRPAAEVRAELEKLDELTLFVQRIHRDRPEVVETAAAQALASALGDQAARSAVNQPSYASTPSRLSVSTPPSHLGTVEGATVRAPQPDYYEDPRPQRLVQPAARSMPEYVRGTRDNSPGKATPAATPAAAARASHVPAPPPPLPEQQVLPVAWGLTLLAWQAGLAVGAGLTVMRLIYWPGGIHAGLSPAAQGWLTVLGLLIALATGVGVAAYRRLTRRLGLLVHLSAVVTLAYLAAWTHAAGDSSRLLDAPGAAWWSLTALCWLGLGLAAYLRDLRPTVIQLERKQAAPANPKR